MAGKRTSLASLAGAKVETVPGHGDPTLVRLSLDSIAPTPVNTRKNFGTAESLTELGESLRRRQLQSIVVVPRTAYLRIFPEHREQVGTATHVLANGERRYRAAKQVNLDSLEAVIREEVADSRQDFIDAVTSENLDRKNLDPIEEAEAVELMVGECGSATAAAQRFGRTSGWVSQRRSLLKLVPEVQSLVRSGEIPVREARELVGVAADEQMAAWRGRAVQREQEKAKPRPARKFKAVPDPRPELGKQKALPEDADPERERTPASPAADDGQGVYRGKNSLSAPTGQLTLVPGSPESAAGVEAEAPLLLPKPMPWHDPRQVLLIAREKMTREDFAVLLKQAAKMLQDI